MLFCKVFIFVIKIYLDCFNSVSKMLYIVAYVIMKGSHVESFFCYITIAYFCNNCSPFVNLFNSYMMLLGNVLIIDLFESYIVQCKFNVNVCILIKIHWLLLMEMCWRDFLMIIYCFLWLHNCVVHIPLIVICQYIMFA
jgi:hypothetical protein